MSILSAISFLVAVPGLVLGASGDLPSIVSDTEGVGFSRSQASVPDGPTIQRIGAWPYGPSLAIAHDPVRDLAFLGAGGVVLTLDASDPAAPTLLNEDIHSVGLVEDIFYQAETELLFLAVGEGGLEIWDVGEPTAPLRLSATEVLYFGYDTLVGHVEVRDNLAVTECGWGYVEVLDVTDPTQPVQVSFNGQMGNPARDIHISEDGLIHTTGAQRYQRLSMEPNGALHLAGAKDFDHGPYAVFGTSEVAYVGYGGYLFILDLLIPGFPLWSAIDVGGLPALEVVDGLAYVINGMGLRIFDVTVHNNPFHVATLPSEMSYKDLVVSDGYAWVAAGVDGLRIIDVGDPAAPVEVGAYEDVLSVTWKTVVIDDLAYVAHDRDGLMILDLETLERPELIGEIAWPDGANDVAIQGSLAYVANALGGLKVVDVSDPTAPTEVGSLDGIYATRVRVAGDAAYILHAEVNDPYVLRVVDVSDPAQPTEIASAALPGMAWNLALGEETLFIAGDDFGVRLFDVTTPAAPTPIGSIALPSVTEVAVRGDVLYVAAHEDTGGGFILYEVSDPLAPQLLGSYSTPGFAPFHLAQDGDYAYVSRGSYLYLFLVSDPSTPLLLEEYLLPGDFFAVAARGDGLVFVSDGAAGLQIVENTLFGNPGGGLLWQALDSGTSENLNGVSFVDSQTGWVVGNLGTLLATTDGGESWSAQEVGAIDLAAVDFVNAASGWTVGAGGVILHTADGGATWSSQASGTAEPLTDVDFVDAASGWAVGANGVILHTADGGATWSPQASGTAAGLLSVSFADGSTGWAVPSSGFGALLSTLDGGSRWQEIDTGSGAILLAVDFPDASNGWAVGSFGEAVRTADGGASWVRQSTPHPPHWLHDVEFVDAATGWAVGFNGQVLATSTAGEVWEDQPTGVHAQLNAVSFVDAGHGWAVGESGTILRALASPAGNEIFADGFESGDTSAWQVTVP